MKILDRYIISSILRIAIFAIIIFALLLAAVELFSKMDQIMTGDVPTDKLIQYVALSIPEYLMMVASLAFLFACTYFLSSLTANNERIALLNSGISKFRISLPIVILSLIVTGIGFIYQENYLNKIIATHDELEVELFGSSSTTDARNIVLRDENGYLIYTNRFFDNNNEIVRPILVKYEDGKLLKRIEAEYAIWENEEWVFHEAKIYELGEEEVSSRFDDKHIESEFKIEPHLFRSQNTSIETMDGPTARSYLGRLYVVDRESWQEKATDYYRALCQPLGIFVLMFISVSMSYHFKKNVLLFSIIQSLSIAVVYYVGDMVCSIAAHQGAITPAMSVIMPLALTVFIAWVISLLGKKI